MDAVVKIERMAYSPDAVGHLPNGKTVFVEGAAPGDTVDIKVTEDKSTYARARVERILEASPVRTAPTSQVDLLCGTAPWQHLQYDAQLEYKRANVVDAVARRRPCTEALGPDVDRIGTMLNGCQSALQVLGGRQQLDGAAVRVI